MNAHAPGFGVLDHVVEGLLGEAVERLLDPGGQPDFLAGHADVRFQARSGLHRGETRLNRPNEPLLLERRTMPGELPEDVVADFTSVLEALRTSEPSLDATLRMTLERPGSEVAIDGPLVQGLLNAAAEEATPADVEGMTAWVDAAFLNEAGVPAVCYGPGSIEQAHTVDEWIDVDEIRVCARVLERFARALV